jgi:hypothetical protein
MKIMDKQLDEFLAKYSRESRENVLCLRKLLFEIFPSATEQIDDKAGMITYSVPKRKKWVLAIAVHMKHINLIFSGGAQISDPSGLLAGRGKEIRHIKIRSEDETQNSNLQTILKEALKVF